MGLTIRLTEAAINDGILLDQYLIAKFSPRVSKRFMEETMKTIKNIAQLPHLFPQSQNHHRVRKCVLHPNTTMYYRVDDKQLAILRLFSNRQHPSKLKL